MNRKFNMTMLIKGNFKLASAIQKSILPIAGGFAAASPFISVDVFALPQGGQVQAGSANISQSSNNTVIHQHSNKAVIQWNSFNINANESVNFYQPSASSAILNKIIDQNPSKILGNLSSNGQVFLINPNGIIFGKSSRVNVGGIVASSLDISTDDFMSGKYTFTKNLKNKSSKVINKGLINASSSGVILIGSNVMNEGKIYAKLGNVSLVSANKISVDFDGDGLIQFQIEKTLIEKDKSDKRSVTNTGEIISKGGHVILTAQTSKDVFTHVVNNEGVIKASRIKKKGGDVFLIGANQSDIVNTGVIDVSGTDIAGIDVNQVAGNIVLQGTNIYSSGHLVADSFSNESGKIYLEANKKVNVSGTLSAVGKKSSSKGGAIEVIGKTVTIENNTLIDASGHNGGGEILIGGDFQGKGKTKTAKETIISKNVAIKADAMSSGDGGKVIIWSDKKTLFKGNISSKGGEKSGNGGFVEVSGKKNLKFIGTVDTSSNTGESGVLLLDPEFIKVVEFKGSESIFNDSSSWADDTISFEEELSESITLTKKQLENIKANIVLQATTGIEFEEFELNLNNDLTLETRNSLMHSDESQSIGNIHGIDISKSTIIINKGRLVINSGQNSDGDNDSSTTVKLGKLSVEEGINVSSSNGIILHDDILTLGDIILNSNTDSIILAQGDGSGITLNSSVKVKSNAGNVVFNGKLDGLNTQDLSLNAQFGEVTVDEVSNVNNLTIQSQRLTLKNNISANDDIDFSTVLNTDLKADINIESISGDIDLSNGINNLHKDHTLQLLSVNDVKLGETILKELTVNADEMQITGDISAEKTLDFSGVKSANINGNISIESIKENINLSQTNITGDQLSLSALNGMVSLGNTDLQTLSIYANSASLYKDIQTSNYLDLNNVTSIVLENSLTLKSKLINTSILSGNYDLTLNADMIYIDKMTVKNFYTSSANSTIYLNGNIASEDKISFAANNTLNLLKDVKISSKGSQVLAQSINGIFNLTLENTNAQIDINDINTKSLTVINAGISNLNGNITTQNNLNFSQTDKLVLSNDVTLESISGNIDLTQGIDATSKTLELKSKNIINLGTSQLKELKVFGNTLELLGDVTSHENITINSLTTLVNGNRTLKSTLKNIDLSYASLIGDDLSISALNGDITLGQVNLESLKLEAKNVELSNNIETKYLLDLNNVKTIVLENDLKLSTLQGDLLVNSMIDGSNFDLLLDAKQIDFGAGQLKSFAASADNIKILGDIVTRGDITFNTNNQTDISGYRNFESNLGNINFIQTHLKGDALTLKALNGNVNLGLVNLQALTVFAQYANLFNDINTQYRLDLNNSTSVVLNNSLSLKSQLENLEIITDIDGKTYDLFLEANTINLDKVNVNNLSLDANSITLGETIVDDLSIVRANNTTQLNDNITAQGNILFSKSGTLNLKKNLEIKSNGSQFMASNILGDYDLSLESVSGKIDLHNANINSLQVVNSGITNLNGNITTQEKINFSKANQLNLNSDVKLNSINSKIDISKGIIGNSYDLTMSSDTIEVSDISSVKSLIVDARSMTLNGDISTFSTLDLSKSKTINIHNNVTLLSKKGEIFLDTQINAENMNLNLNADVIHLGSISQPIKVNQLIVSRKGSSTYLNGSIEANSDVNFAEKTTLILEQDTRIKSKGDLNLSENIIGNYALSLSSDNGHNTGSIILKNTDINELKINSAGTTHLNGHVRVSNNVDLSQSNSVKLNNNTKITSTIGNIYIDSDIDGGIYELELNAGKQIKLSSAQLGSIKANSQLLDFVGDTLSVQKNIDLKQVSQLRFNEDSTLSSVVGNINLGDIMFSNDGIDLFLQAENVDLQNISNSEHFASSIKIQSKHIGLSGDVFSHGAIEMNHSNIHLNNNVSIKTINDDIDLRQSTIKGTPYFLGLSSLYGQINLGQIDNINSLRVDTKGDLNLTDSVSTLFDQDFRNTKQIIGNKVDLFSRYGNITFNNMMSDSIDVVAGNNINLLGNINLTNSTSNNHVIMESVNNRVQLAKNSNINAQNIFLKAKLDVLIGHLEGSDIEVRSSHGSILVHNGNAVNVKADQLILSAFNNIGSQLSPVKIDVNYLKIESAKTAVVNGQFNLQDVNGNTQFILPELQFLASAKDYTLNANDFKFIDNGLFIQGINLFSVSDDAVFFNEENEELFSNNEPVSDELSMN